MFTQPVKQLPKRYAQYQRRLLITCCFVALALITQGSLAQSQQSHQGNPSTPLKIRAGFERKGPVNPTERIALHLSRPLAAEEGSLAIFVSQSDLTSLFTASANSLNYSSQALPLPPGKNPLIVYLVSPSGEWNEIARFALRVKKQNAATSNETGNGRSPFGFDQLEFLPSLTVNIKAQSALLFFPQTERPGRINSVDFAFQGSLQTNLSRGDFKSQNQFDFVGTTVQNEALRFGEKNNDAPQLDLSSYLMQFQVKKLKVLLGHHSYGSNRYLIDGFSSRGINVSIPLTSRFDLSFNAANGTSIVGWDNFSGLSKRKHNVVAGTLGYEVFPEHPGWLRFEAAVLRGSLLPLNNFNERTLTDAETSNGFGGRVVATDSQGRLRLEVGYGRSRFGNPADPLLNQGFSVVPVRETTRDALYLELSYQLLKDLTVTTNRKANLSFTFRHNRVDPLFRSVAVSTQADRLDNQAELTFSLGDISATLGHNRLNDNLDDVPSILKTLTRRSGLNVGVPVATFFTKDNPISTWLPRLSYNYERTHAFGAFLPINSDFALTHVPDQASTNHGFNAEWQRDKLRFGYRLSRSHQDNRQVGRERADFQTLVNSFNVGITPHRRFELNFDLSSERASNLEMNRLDRTMRATVSSTLQTTKKSTLAATISSAFASDAANTSRSRNADLDLQWSWRFAWDRDKYRKVQGQFFIRYANRYARATDNIFVFTNLTKLQTMSAGLSFTFF
ncbi:MAG: hypothetical protein M3447_00100 [Acidobacteriota bacterium]|nr:hypothetical protein [Acidobacteriota bacterium]